MDDATSPKEKQQPAAPPAGPRRKYMDQLQEVADRERDEVLIELDDLDNVRSLRCQGWGCADGLDSMRRTWTKIWD